MVFLFLINKTKEIFVNMTNGHYVCSMKRKIFREDILKAGQEIMFDYGYNATGIKQITDAIEIPKGSFYNHFDNKEAFGLEVLENYCKNGIQLHRNALIHLEGSPLVRLQNMYKGLIANYTTNLGFKKGCIMGNFSAELADTHESFRQILDNQFNQIQQIIAATLKEAQEEKEISTSLEPTSTAGFILNSWHGAIIRMKSTANATPFEDFYQLIFNHILIK